MILHIDDIPTTWINTAKNTLHIAYGHTSHGSQITTGMSGLVDFKGDLYAWNDVPLADHLDLDDYFQPGDLGGDWANLTRDYLDIPANSDVNVVMWSWCGQVSSATQEDINTYLNLMSGLEQDYPDVTFIYMTGHLDGTSVNGNLNQRNQQIRDYCQQHDKWLYDFADIESYDPDGLVNYMELMANDNCDYDSNGDGTRESNWAIDWQDTHTLNEDWYECDAAHTYPLNANLKAYAAWWLWARLAGWPGVLNN